MSLNSVFKTVSCVSEVVEDTNPDVWRAAAKNKLENYDLKGALFDIDKSIHYSGNYVYEECWEIRSNIIYEMAKKFYSFGSYDSCINLLDKEFYHGNYSKYKQQIYTLKFDSYCKVKQYKKALSIFLHTTYIATSVWICLCVIIISPFIYIGIMKNNADSLHDNIAIECTSKDNEEKVNNNNLNIKYDEKDIVESNKTLQEKKTVKTKSELSMGDVCVGDTKMNIEKILGKPNNTNFDGKYNHSYYDDIEVIYYENVVAMVMSYSSKYKTEKGVAVGKDKKDIIKNYGESSMAYTTGDLRLYEYEFESKDGRKGLLRFAVKIKDDKIYYISARIPDEWISYKKQ